MFKTARRLIKKGSENGVISIERLFDIIANAGVIHFPNVRQHKITGDDRERCFGRGGLDQVRRYVAHMSRDRTSLGKRTFGPTDRTRIEKPQPGHKTCGAAAHSQQFAYEECLLALELHPDGHFVDLAPITRSWAAGLVHCVAATAIDLDSPVVLAERRTGQAFLVVLQLSRCVMGWPLQILCDDSGVFGLLPLLRLQTLIITEPCLPSIIICECGRISPVLDAVACMPRFRCQVHDQSVCRVASEEGLVATVWNGCINISRM